MTTAGSPYWQRTNGAETYGGGPDKQDYATPGAVNAQTDVTAAQLRRIASDLAGLARMNPICRLLVQCNDASPAAPTVLSCVLPNESRTAPYDGDSPPAGFPSLERLGTGSFRVTLPATLTDDAGETAAPVIRFPEAYHQGTTNAAAEIAAFTATTVDVNVANIGVAVGDQIVIVEVS